MADGGNHYRCPKDAEYFRDGEMLSHTNRRRGNPHLYRQEAAGDEPLHVSHSGDCPPLARSQSLGILPSFGPAGPFRQAESGSPCWAFAAWVHKFPECVGRIGTARLAAHCLPPLSMTPSEPLAVSDTDPNPESGSMPTAASSHEQVLRRLTTRLFSQDELPSLLKTIFSNRESTHMVHSLQRGDAQVVVDILDEVCHHTPINLKGWTYSFLNFLYPIDQALDGTSLSPSIRNKCMRSLYKMCARHTLIPTSLRITLCDDPTNIVLFRGGFGDVSKRIYEEQEVAVKTLRTYSTSDLQTIIRVRFSDTGSYANYR